MVRLQGLILFVRERCTFFHLFNLLFLPSSSVSLSYFTLSVSCISVWDNTPAWILLFQRVLNSSCFFSQQRNDSCACRRFTVKPTILIILLLLLIFRHIFKPSTHILIKCIKWRIFCKIFTGGDEFCDDDKNTQRKRINK